MRTPEALAHNLRAWLETASLQELAILLETLREELAARHLPAEHVARAYGQLHALLASMATFGRPPPARRDTP